MSVDLASVLDDCIECIAQGEKLETCLERYPEQAYELRQLLGAAARLEQGAHLRPSAAFKARARNRLYAHMAAHPRQRAAAPRLSLFPRLAIGLAICLITFAITTTALAQSALPGGALYFWKLTSEDAWRVVSPDPVGVDLALGDRRIDEAMAMGSDRAAQERVMIAYRKVVTDLTKYQDAAAQERIKAELEIQQKRLQDAGLKVPEGNEQKSSPSPDLPDKTPSTATPAKGPKDPPGSRGP